MFEDGYDDSAKDNVSGASGSSFIYTGDVPQKPAFPGITEATGVFTLIFLSQYALYYAAAPLSGILNRIAPSISGGPNGATGIFTEALCLALLFIYLFSYRRFSAGEFGLTTREFPANILRGAGYAIVTFITAMLVSAIIFSLMAAFMLVTGWSAAHIQHFFERGAIREKEVMRLVSTPQGMFFALCLAPFFEEFVFRGLLFGSLRRAMPFWAAVCVSAAMFAGLHFYFLAAPAVFVLAVASAMAYEKHGSLVPSVTMHLCWNLRAFVFMGLKH